MITANLKGKPNEESHTSRVSNDVRDDRLTSSRVIYDLKITLGQ